MTASKPWNETPLVESAVLSRAAGCKIHMKIESFQPGRSFKSRGVGNYMLSRLRDHESKHGSGAPIHFYSSSGGNAGIAAACTAAILGHPCTVVVPMSTNQRMIDLIRMAGAKNVVQVGATWFHADAHLREQLLKKDAGGVYVPPFDHPDVWAGNATMVNEMFAQWTSEGHLNRPKPAAIVCSVGGGGLFCGIMQGTRQCGWADVPIIAVETIGAESLYKSVKAGELVTLPAITSQAKSLGAIQVAEQAFRYAKDNSNVKHFVLSDAEAAMGCLKLADEERLMVELSCGVNLAMCYGDRLSKALGRKLGAEEEIIIVTCGGSGVTIDELQRWRSEFHDELQAMELATATNGSI